jgi:beta-mannosidase
LDEFIYFSQLNQRDAMRCAIEHYRRSEFCKGTLIWQLNDCWPVQSWSLIDSERDWKAAAYELQRLYESEMVSFERLGDRMRLWRINDGDTEEEVPDFEIVQAYDSVTGEVLFTEPVPKGILEAGERKVVLEFDVSGFDPVRTILVTNSTFDPTRLLCEPKDLRLSKPKIRARVKGDGALEVAPDMPVVDLYLWDPTGGAQFVAKKNSWPTGNFRTFENHIPWSYGFTGTIGKLMGRSLAGVHEIEIVDKPVWPWKE